jgi:acyl carrier protein
VTEVETVLVQHREIQGVVVTGINDQSGNTKLVAYVVPRSRPEPTVAVLKLFLRDKLPEYMIPTEFVFLDELPLTSTGKIDRRALPEPNHQRCDRGIDITRPRTPIEATLANIWAEVLSVPIISINDRFFELGGHSLAASQVISRVNQRFHLELSLKALFDAPTIAEMALLITENKASRASETELAQIMSEVEAMADIEAQEQLARTDDE